MTDIQTIKCFALAGVLLFLLLTVSFFMDGHHINSCTEEGGIVETATAVGYFLCAAFIICKGKLAYLKQYPDLFLLIIFFLLKELDADSRFTTMGILKIKFFISNEVPLVEKTVGAAVLLFLLYIVSSICRRHWKAFYRGLKINSTNSLGALIVAILLAVSMSLDGIDRKLHGFVEIGEIASMHASSVEEILELGIPIFLLLTFNAYFNPHARGEHNE